MPKLVVTSRGFHETRHARSAVRRAVPEGRLRATGFRGVFVLEAEGDPVDLAEQVTRECREEIGHATAVLGEVESRDDEIRRLAVSIALDRVQKGEAFCFRLNKRGSHWIVQDTPALESDIGGAIGTALEEKHGQRPKVDLVHPDITIVAEVLGPITDVGLSRPARPQAPARAGASLPSEGPDSRRN